MEKHYTKIKSKVTGKIYTVKKKTNIGYFTTCGDFINKKIATIVSIPISEGMKWDNEKRRWDLLPFEVIANVVDVLTYGAKKYAAWNWLKVTEYKWRYFSAAMRHLTAYWMGQETDDESGMHHLDHALTNLIFLRGKTLGIKEPKYDK